VTTYVYAFPSGGAVFYIDCEYVYPMGGGQPAYWISNGYWYKMPPTGQAMFFADGKNIYPMAGGSPKLYLTD